MPTSFQLVVPTNIPEEQVARVLLPAIRRGLWKPGFVDSVGRTISAERQYRDRICGVDWKFEYALFLEWGSPSSRVDLVKQLGDKRWGLTPTGSVLAINVTENKHVWTQQECQKLALALADACIKYGAHVLPTVGATKGARWSTPNELRMAGYLGDVEDEQMIISADQNGTFLRIPESQTNRHAIICGPTGCGKSSGLFIPNLLERTGASAIVTEATGGKGIAGLYRDTHAYRRSKGHEIYYFNPDDLTSDRINPLDFINTEADAVRVTEIIMQSTTLSTHRGDQSWEFSERLLLTSLLLHAVSERDKGNCNMSAVARLVMTGARGLTDTLRHSDILEATEIYDAFHETATEGYRNLVINGLINRVRRWREPRIKALTDCTDIDFHSLPEKLFTLYFAVPAEKDELKQVSAILFNFVLTFVMGHRFAHPIFLSLDEFTNFGYVARMPQKLTILRHDGLPVMLGVQDFQQLKLIYKDEAALLISQPATKIFFKPGDHETARRISDMLGQAIEESQQKVTSSGHLKDNVEKTPLLSMEELLNLGTIDERTSVVEAGKPHMVVFLPETRPAKVPALTWREYTDLTDHKKYPPMQRRSLEVNEQLTRRSRLPAESQSTSSASTNKEPFSLGKDRTEEEMNADAAPYTNPNAPGPEVGPAGERDSDWLTNW